MASLVTPLFMSTRREAQRVHGQNLKYVKGGDTWHEKRTDDLAGCAPEHHLRACCRSTAGPAAPLPVGHRVGSDHRFTGRGVVAAFLDSGFYAHPDLTQPVNRILEYVDLVGRPLGAAGALGAGRLELARDDDQRRRGRKRLSVRRPLPVARARDRLLLVKVRHAARIRHDDITRGIEWVVENRDAARHPDPQHLVRRRLRGELPGGPALTMPPRTRCARASWWCARWGTRATVRAMSFRPASTPAVISRGRARTTSADPALGRLLPYRSSYGPTVDGLQKPEVITLADFLAAPILPGTPTAREAELLTRLDAAPDSELSPLLAQNRGVFGPLDGLEEKQPYLIRQVVAAGLRDGLVIDENYKRVDGTSFAAPIVTSIVAQMLEANPALGPGEVKRILIRTAQRVPGIEVERQGWGVVRPEAAVEAALQAR